MEKSSKIFVAGHRGLAGSAICRVLQKKGYSNIIVRNHSELDLTDHQAVKVFFEQEKPEYVFLAAAKVGGIWANNTYPADFLSVNLKIQTNVIESAYNHGVKKLCFLGSSCIYPKLAPQPLKEEYLLTGPLEPTNDAYAIAKIAGIKLCQAFNKQYGTNFISVMPTNLYGQNDNYDLQNSHVLPALIRKFCEAVDQGKKEVVVWGTGTPRREFMYSDDMADACLFLMGNYDETDIVNIGVGEEIPIKDLAQLIARLSGFKGELVFDRSKPDGTPRKLLDVSKLKSMGWKPTVSLEEGIAATIAAFRKSHSIEMVAS